MTPTKKCSGCKRELPATNEHFHKSSSGKFGLHHYCKQCMKERYPNRGHNRDYDRNIMVLNVDMSHYPRLFELLKNRAREEIRTMEGQALFYIVKGLGETVLETRYGKSKK